MANKQDLVVAVAGQLETSQKEAKVAVEAVVGAIQALLVETGEVKIPKFGAFEVRERSARKGRNPQTGEEIDIAATKSPAFKAAQGLKEAVKA
jgi:DNA-binding protein HU-beta